MPAVARARRFNALLGMLLAAAILCTVGVSASAAQSLRVTTTSQAVFPDRTLLLSVPSSANLTASGVHITENGRPISGASVASLGQGGGGDLGVVLMIDTDSSMAGAALDQALGAARTLVSQRTGAEQLGVIFGDGTRVPLTTDSAALDRALAHPPRVHTVMNLQHMTNTAIKELHAPGIAKRAVIYVTDDIDSNPAFTPRSVGVLAAAAHVQIFTVGIPDSIWTKPLPQDRPSPASMRTLAEASGGGYIEALPSQERNAFLNIAAGLVGQYLVHYHSTQPFDKTVAVSIRVDGVPGVADISYRSPAAPRVTPAARHPVHDRPFWTSSLALVLAALLIALLVGLAVAALAAHFSRAGQLRGRVQQFVAPAPEATRARVESLEKGRSLINRVLERRRWWPGFVEQVDISSFTRSAEQLVRLAIIASLIAAVLLNFITGSFLFAMLGLLAGPIGIRWLVKRSVRKQRQKFAEQLPGHLHELASTMRTGRSITDGIVIVAESAEEPMRRELQRVIADESAGLHLDEALMPVASRMQSTEIEQVSVIAALHRRTGANITEVLDRIADTARQRVEIRRELTAMTAQARMSRNVLVSLPLFVAIAIDIIAHRYERPLFDTTIGIVVMVIAAMMVGLGAKIMNRFVTVED